MPPARPSISRAWAGRSTSTARPWTPAHPARTHVSFAAGAGLASQRSKALIRTPKLHFLDSEIEAALRRLGEEDLRRDRSKLAGLLEGFVFSDLAKQVGQESEPIAIYHLRDRDQVEVDFVLEQRGRTVGIEVKATAFVKPVDFHGLKQLGDAARDSFACGIVLHDCERVERIGERLFAMPIDRLWR